MLNKLSGALNSLGRSNADFGGYYLRSQRKCARTCQSADCEGGPTRDEASRDYQNMVQLGYYSRGFPLVG